MKKKYSALTGDKIILEPASEKFVTEQSVSWFNDPVVCRDNRHGQGDYTLEKAKKYYESVLVSDSIYPFAIVEKNSLKHVGNISLCSISAANRSGEIAVLIGEKSAWGSGIGYEACRLVLRFAFESMDLHRVKMGMTSRNKAMIRISEKLGMKHEGTFKHALLKGDEYLDIVQYACINPGHSERKISS